MIFKHISFDFWETLYTSNPNYKHCRNTAAAEFLAKRDLVISVDLVDTAFSQVKAICNYTQEITGIAIKPIQMYGMVLAILVKECSSAQINSEMVDRFKEVCDNTFINNLPIIIADVKSTLTYLQAKGYTLSITSNTGFISIELLYLPLKKDGIFSLFSDFLGSDKAGVCKPELLKTLAKNTKNNQTLHVGDRWCDNPLDVIGIKVYNYMLTTHKIQPKSGISKIINIYDL